MLAPHEVCPVPRWATLRGQGNASAPSAPTEPSPWRRGRSRDERQQRPRPGCPAAPGVGWAATGAQLGKEQMTVESLPEGGWDPELSSLSRQNWTWPRGRGRFAGGVGPDRGGGALGWDRARLRGSRWQQLWAPACHACGAAVWRAAPRGLRRGGLVMPASPWPQSTEGSAPGCHPPATGQAQPLSRIRALIP